MAKSPWAFCHPEDPRAGFMGPTNALRQTSSAIRTIQFAGTQSLASAPASDSLIATRVCLYLVVDDGSVRGWRGIAE